MLGDALFVPGSVFFASPFIEFLTTYRGCNLLAHCLGYSLPFSSHTLKCPPPTTLSCEMGCSQRLGLGKGGNYKDGRAGHTNEDDGKTTTTMPVSITANYGEFGRHIQESMEAWGKGGETNLMTMTTLMRQQRTDMLLKLKWWKGEERTITVDGFVRKRIDQ